jgi:hypothetical protein
VFLEYKFGVGWVKGKCKGLLFRIGVQGFLEDWVWEHWIEREKDKERVVGDEE